MEKEKIEKMKYFLKLKNINETDNSDELIDEIIKEVEKNEREAND